MQVIVEPWITAKQGRATGLAFCSTDHHPGHIQAFAKTGWEDYVFIDRTSFFMARMAEPRLGPGCFETR
jgi:hypothetical protein